MWKRISKAGVTAACLLLQLAGCGTDPNYVNSTDQYVVGVVTKSSSSEYWMSVASGIEAAAAKYGMEVIFLSPDSESKRDVQEKLVEKLIDREVDALAVAPIDSYNLPRYLEVAKEKNIPIVSFDTGYQKKDIPYIGIDNYKTGYELARTLAETLGHTGDVGVVSGDLKQMGHRERTEGFCRYIETEPNMNVAFVESGYANLKMSQQKVQKLLDEYPNVKGIMATSAVTALGLAEEVKGTNVQIVTIDAQADSLRSLEEGEISALAAQSGYQIGYETIRYIEQHRQGKSTGSGRILEAGILTKDNVELYRKEAWDEKYSK